MEEPVPVFHYRLKIAFATLYMKRLGNSFFIMKFILVQSVGKSKCVLQYTTTDDYFQTLRSQFVFRWGCFYDIPWLTYWANIVFSIYSYYFYKQRYRYLLKQKNGRPFLNEAGFPLSRFGSSIGSETFTFLVTNLKKEVKIHVTHKKFTSWKLFRFTTAPQNSRNLEEFLCRKKKKMLTRFETQISHFIKRAAKQTMSVELWTLVRITL